MKCRKIEELMPQLQELVEKEINAGKMKPERVKKFEELQELMEEYKRVNQYQ